VSGVVVDTSVWIDFFAGASIPALEDALAHGGVVLTPIVVAELVSGARRANDRAAITDLTRQLALHEARLDHWIRVGELRRDLRSHGVTASTPDVHVAQCALERGALLLSRDAIFARIARHSALRLQRG
jgi:predicted nucleic acid-binding protein